jgi:hypothetical protein
VCARCILIPFEIFESLLCSPGFETFFVNVLTFPNSRKEDLLGYVSISCVDRCEHPEELTHSRNLALERYLLETIFLTAMDTVVVNGETIDLSHTRNALVFEPVDERLNPVAVGFDSRLAEVVPSLLQINILGNVRGNVTEFVTHQ